jgi:hypothetical protein
MTNGSGCGSERQKNIRIVDPKHCFPDPMQGGKCKCGSLRIRSIVKTVIKLIRHLDLKHLVAKVVLPQLLLCGLLGGGGGRHLVHRTQVLLFEPVANPNQDGTVSNQLTDAGRGGMWGMD